ncbi:Cleavage polyadenylation factor subunit clp1, partial [Cladochytrium tenue]
MSDSDTARAIQVEAEHELRLEVGFKDTVTLKVRSGFAEIFGTELAENAEYQFSGKKLAVFSWEGCRIEIRKCDDYVAGGTPMHSYLNIHLALEQLRREAAATGAPGPKVMVVGPSDAGKSSLCKILVNYAIKCDRKPLFVDIDTNEGSLSVPGTMAGMVFLRNIDVEEEFGSDAQSTGSTPIVFYYGYASPTEKPRLYMRTVSKLADVLARKCEEDPD